ncbi:hypothetical protein IFM89_013962 [Coptis chinensis]|uniref:Midasin n=1 Tax=Coptis chinensis TaxID=261450 RepID=A0A835M8T5_9MAGN|nr:hypothetical protein IFM89_013962 [Coptis chinensis]
MLDNVVQSHKYFGIAPFKISKGDDDCKPEDLNSWHQPPVEMQCGYCEQCNLGSLSFGRRTSARHLSECLPAKILLVGGAGKGFKSFLNRFTKVHRLLKEDVFLNTVYIQRMRTAADRQEVVKLYAEHQWLCILVGPSASGKSSVVRLLADLTGNVLNELNLSSATDISELLGCSEQYNAFRSFRSAITQVERYIDEYCSLSLELEDIVLERKDLVSKWFKLLSSMYGNLTAASASAYADSWKSGSGSSLAPLILIVEQLKLGLEKYHFPVSWSAKDLNKVLKSLKDLLDYTKKEAAPTKFEWVTGMLIKAIECGEWIVLENANLCNPTVLDRINSLVEPSGSITVNERGLVEGRPMVLRPKCKFRIFLTVNIKYGEVSRAMRNRGVEVFMMQPDWLHEGEDGYKQKGTMINDVKRFLVLSGGWPTPLKLRNFVLHSKEASVRQNCMYLEFLVAQSASYELSGSHNGDLTMQRSPMNGVGHMSTSSLNSGSTSSFNKLHPSLIPLKMLLPVLFPTTPYQLNSGSTNLPNFDLALVNKMLLFAAN